jgi:hypothetical protein
VVTIAIDGADLDIQVQGMHKLWALKSSLRVPLSDVRRGVRRGGQTRVRLESDPCLTRV